MQIGRSIQGPVSIKQNSIIYSGTSLIKASEMQPPRATNGFGTDWSTYMYVSHTKHTLKSGHLGNSLTSQKVSPEGWNLYAYSSQKWRKHSFLPQKYHAEFSECMHVHRKSICACATAYAMPPNYMHAMCQFAAKGCSTD